MNRTRRRHSRAFTMLELVIVVVILGIIAAIAIPRLSRGSAGASDSALSGNLAVLRNAVDLFAAEHNGTYPKLATFEAQLTTYSDASGAAQAARDTTHIYGPYLRALPPLPVGADKGKTSLVSAYTSGNGWVYDEATGKISANCPGTEADVGGKAYNAY
jgi:prepilin-type N-terminal cleavage/methylation domain-containing protein